MTLKYDYDAIIVGARVAGAPAAMLLARKGYRVLFVDKARFPSDSINGYQLRVRGLAYLDDWGLLDRLLATGVPPIRKNRFVAGPMDICANVTAFNGIDFELNPRRYVIDDLLARAALEAGAEFQDGFRVEDLLFDDGRVVGLRGRRGGGDPVSVTARIVVGADGANSFVARTVGAPKYVDQPSMGFGYFAHWSGVETDATETHLAGDAFCGVFPTHDGHAAIAIGMPTAGFEAFRRDVEGSFRRAIGAFPEIEGRLRAGRREDRFTGIAGVQNFFRTPYGPGWALVGDAGYTRDPAHAQGMTDALRDADLLATAIDEGFAGRGALSDALAEYHRARDAAAMPMFRLVNRIDPLPHVMPQLLMAFRGDQREIDHLFAATAGTISPGEYFSPENVERMLKREAVAA